MSESIRNGSRRRFGRSGMAAGVGTVLLLTCLLAVFVTKAVSRWTMEDEAQILWAIEDARNALLANPGCPEDLVEEMLPGAFFFLHPDIALRELRKDPKFAEAERKAIDEFMNPKVYLAERMEDPEFRRQVEEAIEAFGASAERAGSK
jgi:hypothetical protein